MTTLTFNPPTPGPDAEADVLASVLRDDGVIELWEAHFQHSAWWSSNSTMITSPVVSWAHKPAGVDMRGGVAQPASQEPVCPMCDGAGTITEMSDNSPDAFEVDVACPHCSGACSLDAAYAGVVALLKIATENYHRALPYMVKALNEAAGLPPPEVPASQEQPSRGVPEIDYQALIHAAWGSHKYAQGTRGCVAFKHGAEWFRGLLTATPAKGADHG